MAKLRTEKAGLLTIMVVSAVLTAYCLLNTGVIPCILSFLITYFCAGYYLTHF